MVALNMIDASFEGVVRDLRQTRLVGCCDSFPVLPSDEASLQVRNYFQEHPAEVVINDGRSVYYSRENIVNLPVKFGVNFIADDAHDYVVREYAHLFLQHSRMKTYYQEDEIMEQTFTVACEIEACRTKGVSKSGICYETSATDETFPCAKKGRYLYEIYEALVEEYGDQIEQVGKGGNDNQNDKGNKGNNENSQSDSQDGDGEGQNGTGNGEQQSDGGNSDGNNPGEQELAGDDGAGTSNPDSQSSDGNTGGGDNLDSNSNGDGSSKDVEAGNDTRNNNQGSGQDSGNGNSNSPQQQVSGGDSVRGKQPPQQQQRSNPQPAGNNQQGSPRSSGTSEKSQPTNGQPQRNDSDNSGHREPKSDLTQAQKDTILKTLARRDEAASPLDGDGQMLEAEGIDPGTGTEELAVEELIDTTYERWKNRQVKKQLSRLKSAIQGTVSRRKKDTYARPSTRRIMSNGLLTKGRKKDLVGQPTILVALDASGSMSAQRVKDLTNSIGSIFDDLGRPKKGCYICMFDDDILAVRPMRQWREIVSKYRSYGGTNYPAVVRLANDLDVDVVIEVGDGEGRVTDSRKSNQLKKFLERGRKWYDVLVLRNEDDLRHMLNTHLYYDRNLGVDRTPICLDGNIARVLTEIERMHEKNS